MTASMDGGKLADWNKQGQQEKKVLKDTACSRSSQSCSPLVCDAASYVTYAMYIRGNRERNAHVGCIEDVVNNHYL